MLTTDRVFCFTGFSKNFVHVMAQHAVVMHSSSQGDQWEIKLQLSSEAATNLVPPASHVHVAVAPQTSLSKTLALKFPKSLWKPDSNELSFTVINICPFSVSLQ